VSTGRFLLSLDLSQAESRVVYMLTRDPKLVLEAQSKPWEHDMHTANAQLIFGRSQEINKDQRYLGKKGVHGAQRDMTGFRLSDELLKDNYIRTPEECQWMIDQYHRAKPAIKGVYFAEVRKKIWDERSLTNSWGRSIHWPHQRFNVELYKEGYSWRPQSEVAELLNMWGVVPTYNFIKKYCQISKLLAQIHDELLINTCLEEAWLVAEAFRCSVEKPRRYDAGWLTIPVTVKIGRTWEGVYEWKQFPSREEFDEKVLELGLGGEL